MHHRALIRLSVAVAAALFTLGAQIPAFADWPTYHKDNARTGNDPGSPPLLNSVSQQWAYSGLDHNAYAEPLVYGNMVLVATEGNTIYALDAGTGGLLWSRNYGTAVPGGQLPCGNISPVGITGTPVIDTASGTLYAVGEMWDGATQSSIHYQLEAINLNAQGAELWHRIIAPTDPTYTFDPLIEGERAALSLANGIVYIPFGGRYGDCGNSVTGTDYRGWVVGASASSQTGTLYSFPLPTGSNTSAAGGFWAASGAAIDASNNVYVTSGNSRCGNTSCYDYGETVFKLSPSLTISDYFVPSNWPALNTSDQDVGSVGPTMLGNNLLFQVGKPGVGYILNTTNMGGTNHMTPVFSAQVCNATGDASFGGVAYAAPYVYVPCSDHIEALNVNTGATPSFTSAWSGPAGSIGPPIVAGGLVWSADWNGTTLFGLDPTTGAQHVTLTLPATPMHFSTPAAGNGKIFMAAGTHVVAYGSTCMASSTRQYSLSSSDGVTWTDMDSAGLRQTLAPTASQWALLEANVDLWTANAGYNQDIGIFVSTNGGTDTLVGWKESGGYGGTFSPNAAFLQVPFQVTAGSTYVVTLKWKTNRDARASGATIYAAAGSSSPYSMTTLSAKLIPTANLSTAVVTTQPSNVGSDGVNWTPLGGVALATMSPAAASTAVLGGNADLWTAVAGYNQDIGVFVSVNGAADTLVAWKESGGFAGTFSPNAAFVHAVYSMAAGSTYAFKLKWKTNKAASSTTGIYAGAGPIGSAYSPTRLTAEVLPAGTNPASSQITTQPFLTGNNGVAWQPVSTSLDQTIAPASDTIVSLGANADLWTARAGLNQDLGIFVSVNGGPDTLVIWKESGGFAGTFSPNAAFAQALFAMSGGHTYTFRLKWKTNVNSGGGTIYMGAGSGPYSPTRLTAETVSC